MLRAAFCLLLCAPAPNMAQETPEKGQDAEPVVALLELLIDVDADTARQCLGVLAEKVQTGELAGERLAQLKPRLEKLLDAPLRAGPENALHVDAALLAASLKNPRGLAAAVQLAADEKQPAQRRLSALDALIAAGDRRALPLAAAILRQPDANSPEFRAGVLGAIGRMKDARAASIVLACYSNLEADLQPKAIELLTQRAAWSKELLRAIGEDKIPAHSLNVNQVAKLVASPDKELRRLVAEKWGAVRTERNPQREKVIADVRKLLTETPADPRRGHAVFNKVCGQCHKIYGEGQEVGPDITGNGRASLVQLLSNVLDPSLVIGASYQARTVITADGRVLTGLLAEDSQERVVLKVQGGKLEKIARDDVEEVYVSKLSLMPEGLEKQLKAQELADLFAFLALDGPPNDPDSKFIPGAGELKAAQ